MENSPSTTESNPEDQRTVAPEANQLHGKNLPPERIGQVLISSEAQPDQTDSAATSAEAISKRVATMSRRELLELSEEIAVDNTTLRHVYDTHLIGENGLRRLVHEHMRGGNLKEALQHEILEHETAFERDPQLRHQQPPQLVRSDTRAKNINLNLNDLLGKAGLTKLDPTRELAAPKLLSEHLAKRSSLQTSQRKLLDVALIAIIVILLILVILLAMSRG